MENYSPKKRVSRLLMRKDSSGGLTKKSDIFSIDITLAVLDNELINHAFLGGGSVRGVNFLW